VTSFVTNRDRSVLLQARFVLLKFAHGVRYVSTAYDRVTLEYRTGSPTPDAHDYAFRNASSSEVSSGCPSEVVEDQAVILRLHLFAFGTTLA
jgi:hypothetical protein